jgi:copper chaperone
LISTHFLSIAKSLKSNHLTNTMTLQLKVPKMSCGGCVSTINQAVQTVDAHAIVRADPQTKMVSVETKASETAIKEAIAKVGYPAS